MLFAVDVDQTISTGYAGKDIQESIAYYEAMGIAVPAHITNYPELFQLPGVLRQHETLPGAVAGVHALAKHGCIAYYTVRKHEDARIEQEIQAITRSWLAEHDFPYSCSVVFCRSVMHKLLQLCKESEDALVLIDDRWHKVGNALEQFAQSEEYRCIADDLCRRLTLVAFGASSVPANPLGLRTIALSTWENTVDLFAFIEE